MSRNNNKAKLSKKAKKHQNDLDAIKVEKPSDNGDDANRTREILFQQAWKRTQLSWYAGIKLG